MTNKTSSGTPPKQDTDGFISDTVWCVRQCTRALSGIFSAVHGVGKITTRALGLVSDFAEATDNGMNRMHNWLIKPKAASLKGPQPQ